MSNTKNSKATFGRKASLNLGSKPSQSTQIIVSSNGISIRVSRVSATKTSGHTRVDFESKRKRDSYKELNKMLGEG